MPQANPSRKNARKLSRRISKAVMRSYRMKLPNYDLPLRFRPWFILFASLFIVLLALLKTTIVQAFPLEAEIVRIVCMCLSTATFYFIFDVEEESRRIWFWRHAALIITASVCFFFGGIVSEIVRAFLPHKFFNIVDVAANLLGSAIGLWLAYYLERYYRYRREISRLYRPVALDPNASPTSDSDYESDEGTMLLPTHYEPRRERTNAPTKTNTSASTKTSSRGKISGGTAGHIRLGPGDVWDEREDDLEVFGIGSEGESDDERQTKRGNERTRRDSEDERAVVGPEIVVSGPPTT